MLDTSVKVSILHCKSKSYIQNITCVKYASIIDICKVKGKNKIIHVVIKSPSCQCFTTISDVYGLVSLPHSNEKHLEMRGFTGQEGDDKLQSESNY